MKCFCLRFGQYNDPLTSSSKFTQITGFNISLSNPGLFTAHLNLKGKDTSGIQTTKLYKKTTRNQIKGTFQPVWHPPQMAMFNSHLYWSLSLLHLLTLPCCTSHFYSPATCFSPIKSESITLEKWVFSTQGLCVNKPHFFLNVNIQTCSTFSSSCMKISLPTWSEMDKSEGNVDKRFLKRFRLP